MGHFVVSVDPVTGLKDVRQVPTLEDAADTDRGNLDAEIDAKLDADLARELERDLEADTAPDLKVADGGADDDDPPADDAANEIMVGIYEQNVAWIKQRVTKIQTQAGIKAVRTMEQFHPEYKDNDPPGRKGVLNALQERSGEITEGQTVSDGLERAPASTRLPCSECEFTAGSQDGLDAHMATKHSDVSL